MIRITLAAVSMFGCLISSAFAAHLPNIVFVMADDMGQGDLGCYNSQSKIPTPNMDRLATQGMRFTDAHTPSSVCTPTRYGVLTGRYCWRSNLKSGVLWGYSPSLIEPNRLTVATMLKEHGYQTGCVGKWHLGLGNQEKVDYSKPLTPGGRAAGFNEFYVIPASLDMDPYVWVHNDRVVELPTAKDPGSKRRWSGGGGFWRAGPKGKSFSHTDVLPVTARKATEFIESHAKNASTKPFFLYVPFSAPHTPWLPTKEFAGKSKASHYGDFTTQVDWCVGQIMQALERTGAAKNTLLIVTSDNGSHWRPQDVKKYAHDAHNGRRGMKADIHEAGHRVPFIARWPGKIKPGSASDQTICLTDLTATAASIVGHNLPNDAAEDSYNILPILLGKAVDKPIREAIVHHSLSGMFAIRKGRWKLILGLGSGGFTAPRTIKPKPDGPQGQLYDLEADQGEKNNVWSKQPKVVAELSALLKRYHTTGRSTASR
jgi:arylsulfatase A-like enzyme